MLSLGQVTADLPEGFATVATFKEKGVPRTKRLILSASLVAPILIGASLGYFVLRGLSEMLPSRRSRSRLGCSWLRRLKTCAQREGCSAIPYRPRVSRNS